eukprot:5017092-Pleurochrysis_carterae.AAC.2
MVDAMWKEEPAIRRYAVGGEFTSDAGQSLLSCCRLCLKPSSRMRFGEGSFNALLRPLVPSFLPVVVHAYNEPPAGSAHQPGRLGMGGVPIL